MAGKAEEVQAYADRNEWANFFAATKAACGLTVTGTTPLRGANKVTLLTEKAQILKLFADRFRNVLNRPSAAISDAVIVQLPHMETNADIDLQVSLHETIRDVQQISGTNPSRSDAIRAEIHKHGVPNLWITSQRPFRR
nr:unnamed protein product [Spirometra erinaceieuropaei]